jgi:integrase
VKFFGKSKRLDQISDADVAAIVAWRRSQTRWGRKKFKSGAPMPAVSNATVNRDTIAVMKKLFTRAKRTWKLPLPLEPNWRDHWLKETGERVRELDSHEGDSLDTAIRADYAPWFEFARLTGLRRSETLIRWKNVNRLSGQIILTGKGGRKVTTPITPDVAAILDQCEGHHSEYVFTYVAMRNSRGKVKGRRYPITYAGSKSEWKRTVKRSGVQDFRFHDIRHDTACKLLRETGNLKLVQQALNHENIATTAKYAHALNEDVANGLQRVAESRKKSLTKAKESA